MATGKVARFFDQKGFGFIQPEGGGKDLFVHINEVEGGQLQEGDNVEFDETEGPKGTQATNVKVVRTHRSFFIGDRFLFKQGFSPTPNISFNALC